jgi:ribosomal-protein-alanine N-acetyltransferase
MPYFVMETPRLRLRTWEPEDREPFANLNGDRRVMEFLGGVISPEESHAAADRIDVHFRQHGFGPFVMELRETGVFIGGVGPHVVPFESQFTPAVELVWRLAFDHWGRGYATEGARAALDYCGETLRLKEVVALTVPANLRSRRVMEKIGMIHDAAGDFDHPRLAEGDPLRQHVLYRWKW